MNHYSQFCTVCWYSSPVSELTLCYFVASLALQGLTPATIKAYLARVRHAQIMRGFEEPRQHSTFPCLHLPQAGVKRVRCQQGTPQAGSNCPFCQAIGGGSEPYGVHHLTQMHRRYWQLSHSGFIDLGRLKFPLSLKFPQSLFTPNQHLCWGDVSVDS